MRAKKMDIFDYEQGVINGVVPINVKKFYWLNDLVLINLIIKTGARNDPEGKEGLSHLLEHVVFDGCKNFLDSEDIDRVSKRIFAESLNASTGFEETFFYGIIQKKDAQKAISFLRKMIFYPTLKIGSIKKQKSIIINEYWEEDNNRKQANFLKLVAKDVYGNHSFGRMEMVWGWPDTIASINQHDVFEYHQKFYCKENLAIFLAGDITLRRGLNLAKILIRNIQTGVKTPKPTKISHWSIPRRTERIISATKEYGFLPSARPEQAKLKAKRLFPAQSSPILTDLLAEMVENYLTDIIRNRLKASYDVAVNSEDYIDHVKFEISIKLDPHLVKSVRKIIEQMFDGWGNGGGVKVFQNAKKVFLRKQRIKLALLSPKELLEKAADEWVIYDRVISIKESIDILNALDHKQICNFIHRNISSKSLYWFIENP